MEAMQNPGRSYGAIIRQRGHVFQVESHHHGQRKRETFGTVAVPEAHARRLAQQIKEEGEAALCIAGSARLDAIRLLETFPTRQQQDDAVQAAVMLATNGRGSTGTRRCRPRWPRPSASG